MAKKPLPTPRPNGYAPWRAATLALVYVLFALHYAHWKITGKSLAPLELNEVMHTLELGVITAGFLFMAAALVATGIFGRFFCSWGCHIMALQDLSMWILKKLRIRPVPFRSRVLLFVPPFAIVYMFVWPQVARLIVRGWPQTTAMLGPRPEFNLRIASDAESWASFVTTDFTRNLPGPVIGGLTFLLCGFVIVYLLGQRSFCRYGCPYGVLFGLLDRLAPGRIVLSGNCEKCGLCTANCHSGVRVHEEINKFGRVIDSRCLKDLDCVAGCPNEAISYGKGKPAFFGDTPAGDEPRFRSNLSAGEEWLVGSSYVASLLIFRGLYGYVPFLMTLGIGTILGFLAVMAVRLVRRPTVKHGTKPLKVTGRLTGAGKRFATALVLVAVFLVHSAFIRVHEVLGERDYDRLQEKWAAGQEAPAAELDGLWSHLEAQRRFGIVDSPEIDAPTADVAMRLGMADPAADALRRIAVRQPANWDARLRLATVLAAQGRAAEVRTELETLLLDTQRARPNTEAAATAHDARAAAIEMLASVDAVTGERDRAIARLRAAMEAEPHPRIEAALNALLAAQE